MKKSIFVLALFFLVPLVSAIEVDMNDNFHQSETMIAKVSGIFMQEITTEDLYLYRDYHVRIPIDFGILKIDSNNYYIYAQLDKSSGNYSLVLKDVQYQQAGKIVQGDYWKNFTISDGVADFQVNPGAINSKSDFSVDLINLKEVSLEVGKRIVNTTSSENVSEGFWASLFGSSTESSSGEKIILLPGETKTVDFKISKFNKSGFVQLTSNNTEYFVPVTVNKSSETPSVELYFVSSDVNVSISTNSNTSRIIYLKNSGTSDAENISLVLSNSIKNYVNISVKKIEEIKANSTYVVYINFSSVNSSFVVNGSLDVKYSGEIQDSLLIYFNVIKGYVPPKNVSTNVSSNKSSYSKTCSELGGIICSSGQNCSVSLVDSTSGKCCVGKCNNIEKSNSKKILGWVILGVIVLFLLWFYFRKYSKPKKPVDVLEVSKLLSKMQKNIKK